MLIATDKPMPARRPFDHYETDHGTIEAAMNLITDRPRYVLDIGAGSGRWSNAACRRWPGATITGVEIQHLPAPEGVDLWFRGISFPQCSRDLIEGQDLIGFNPPYRNVEAIVRAGIELLSPTGRMMFLLPLRFLEGQGRANGLFKDNPPYAVHVCSKRPSFQEDGKTNATAFALFLWSRNYCSHTELKWLRP